MTHIVRRLFELDISGENAAQWATQRITLAGLPVHRSFDLHSARLAHPECTCPHHGSAACNCQFIVLLVYTDAAYAPATLVVHSQDDHSWFELHLAPSDEREQGACDQIMQALFSVSPH